MSETSIDQSITTLANQLHTVKDMMRWGASEFMRHQLSFSHGMADAVDESVYLVLRSLALPVDTPDIYWDGTLTQDERITVLTCLLKRVKERIPAAYLTQEGWFAGLPFYVDERVLIPRSPIAELVENQFQPWIDEEQVHNILDMATGSGCIGIACAYAFPQAKVDLVDVSAEALAVADINIQRHDVSASVSTVLSDGYQALTGKQYDIIVCNPPYVDAEDMQGLAHEFHHEPALALASGDDGLDFTRTFLQRSAEFLTEDGILIVEVGNSQYALAALYPEVPFYWFDFERGGSGVFLLTRQQLTSFFT